MGRGLRHDRATYIKEEIDDKGLGRESILVGHGTGRNINWQVPFIAGACFRTANVGGIYFSGWWCYMPRVCGAVGPLGDYPIVDASETLPDRYANPEWKNPDVLVVWGNEPLTSNGDGYVGHWLVSACRWARRSSPSTRAHVVGRRAPSTGCSRIPAPTRHRARVAERHHEEDLTTPSTWRLVRGLRRAGRILTGHHARMGRRHLGLPPTTSVPPPACTPTPSRRHPVGPGVRRGTSRHALGRGGCDLMAICGNVDVPGSTSWCTTRSTSTRATRRWT